MSKLGQQENIGAFKNLTSKFALGVDREGDACSHVLDGEGDAVQRELLLLLLRLRRQQLEFLHEGAVVSALPTHRHALPLALPSCSRHLSTKAKQSSIVD